MGEGKDRGLAGRVQVKLRPRWAANRSESVFRARTSSSSLPSSSSPPSAYKAKGIILLPSYAGKGDLSEGLLVVGAVPAASLASAPCSKRQERTRPRKWQPSIDVFIIVDDRSPAAAAFASRHVAEGTRESQSSSPVSSADPAASLAQPTLPNAVPAASIHR